MRERFGNWGAELSDAEFACALAAAGALWALQPPRGVDLKPGLLASRIWLFRTPEGILPWRLTRLPPRLDARLLLESWRSFRDFAGQESFRIEVQASLADLRWVLKQLSRPEVGAASVESWDLPTRGRRKSPAEGSYSVKDDEPPTDSIKTGYDISGDPVTRASVEEVRESPPRFLQAQLQPRPRGWYQVNVRIGLPDREWTAVEKPFPVPPEPPEPEGHRLTVIFWEPRVSPDAKVEHLWLPPKGNSEPVFFPFEVPDGVKEIAARITVLHNNRVLQTGLLRASFAGRRPWTFTLDATPRTRLEGFSGRSRFDVALVLNHDDKGTARAMMAADGQAVVLDLDDGPLNALTDFLNHQISAIADDPKRYESLDSPGTLELFRSLAVMGANLHDVLCEHQRLSRLADARRIHITSARAESFFPVELLYRFRPPSPSARLCPHAAAALDSGDCSADCSSDKRQTVCPLGFWGLSRVIERHGHEPEDGERASGDFELRAEPVRKRNTLPVSRTALLAASDRANEADANAVGSLLQKLRQRGAAAQAATWEEWEQHVASDLPGLLVLLPHHERQGGFDVLAIGDGEQLQSAAIWYEQVRRQPDGPHPLVLLIGCATNLTRVSFDNPAGRFHDKGAALVVSTIATILGRHASPATAMLVELLDEMAADGDRTLGDVMLRLRQKLVAKQTPMALGLTAYGDADWILTRQD